MRSNLALFCTPAVNLFEKRADRIHVSDGALRVSTSSPDRTRPLDFEVYEVTDVVGHGAGDGQRAAVPAVLLGVQHRRRSISSRPTSRRAASRGWCRRRRSAAARDRATSAREVFLSLVDPAQAPFAATCGSCRSRRCAPTAISCCRCRWASAADRFVAGHRRAGDERPRRQRPEPAVCAAGRRRRRRGARSAICRSTICRSCRRRRQEGAAALRDLLELYAPSADVSARRQIEGIRSVSVGRVVRRLPAPGPLAFGRGLEITVRRRRAGVRGRRAPSCSGRCSIATSRVTCRSTRSPKPCCGRESRGEINRWAPQWGARPTL